MKLSRRSFLKIGGATAFVAAVAPEIIVRPSAPLFIPPQRLDMGVPKALALPEPADLTNAAIADLARSVATPPATAPISPESVPMLLVHDEYLKEWGGRLMAGSTVHVDRETASRWLDYGVAVPAPGYVVDPSNARRAAEAAQEREARTSSREVRAVGYAPSAVAVGNYVDRVEAQLKLAMENGLREPINMDAATDALRSWAKGGKDRPDLVMSPDLGPSSAPVLATKSSVQCRFSTDDMV